MSWLITLAPYIEANQDPRPVSTAAWDAPENRPVARLPYPLTRCCINDRERDGGERDGDGNTWTNFIGVAGVGSNAATLPISSPDVGFFGYDRITKKADLRGGAANTLAIIETAHANRPRAAGGFATVRGIETEDGHPVAQGGPFASRHPGPFRGYFLSRRNGMTLGVMADGSVRIITEDIDPAVLAAMATLGGKPDVE